MAVTRRGSDEANGATVPVAMYQDLLAKYHALVQDLAAMKREGFAPEPAGGPLESAPQLEPAIQQAIGELVDNAVDGPADLERTLMQRAWDLKRRGASTEEITASIAAGEPVES